VQPGWTSDQDQIHRPVRQKQFQILIWFSAVLLAQGSELAWVCAVDGRDFDSSDGTSCACMCICDIPAAD
jgi:hypothetical protein